MSLVASLQRALSEGVPITTPRFWRSPLCTKDVVKRVFRGATAEHIPLLDERIAILYEAGDVLKVGDMSQSRRVMNDHYRSSMMFQMLSQSMAQHYRMHQMMSP